MMVHALVWFVVYALGAWDTRQKTPLSVLPKPLDKYLLLHMVRFLPDVFSTSVDSHPFV